MAPNQSRHLFCYENLVHAIAGAAGSTVAMSAFYPLDTVRSLLQVDDKRKSKNSFLMMREIVREEGFTTLYRGLLPVLISVCASNFIYFYTFHGFKALRGTADKQQSAIRDLFIASLSAAINVLMTTPLWVVAMRLKLQGMKFRSKELSAETVPQYSGLLHGLYKVGRTEGLQGLWSSTLPSLVLVSNPAIQYMVYESLKRQIRRLTGAKELSAWNYFCIGAWAKAVSTVITYPIQLIQSKYRYGNNDKTKQMNILQFILYILRSGGVAGLYKGLEAKLLQTVLTAALMMVFYEKIAAFVFRVLKAKGNRIK